MTAIVGLWFTWNGVRVNGIGLGAIYGLCGLMLAILLWKRCTAVFTWRWAVGGLAGAAIPLLSIAAFLLWRFYQARMLALPAWVDPVHHTLIVRKIMEYGGVPLDLTPYMPVPFYYHYAFHLATALFASLANLSAPKAVLIMGQVINAGIALSVYRLGVTFLPHAGLDEEKGRVASLRALIAALLVGFAFQMPAYYLTWGRYTLLTGLLVIGPCMAAAYEVFENPRQWGAMIRFVLLWAGVFLVHYMAALMVGLYLLVLGIIGLIRAARARRVELLPWLLIALSLVGIALAYPWIERVYLFTKAQAQVNVSIPTDAANLSQWMSPNNWTYLFYLWGPRRNIVLLIFAAIGWGFALRRKELRSLIGWGGMLLFLSLPWGLRLGPFRPDLFNIVIFFPAALFLADLLVSSTDALGMIVRPLISRVVLVGVVMGLVIWGVNETADVLNSDTLLAAPADVLALDWVNGHVPADARFYINTTPWQGVISRGVDGGFWLTPYTGRQAMIPAVVYDWGSKEYFAQVNDWAQRSQKLTGCDAAFWSLMQDANLNYIYLRQGVGNLQPQMLQNCAGVQKVYENGGVFLYKVNPAAP